MKRVFSLLLVICLLLSMVACKAEQPVTSTPGSTASVPGESTGTGSSTTDPSDTGSSVTDPTGTDPAGTDPAPTDPNGTEPAPTDPSGTEPAPTDPTGPNGNNGTEPPVTDPGEETDFISVKGNAAVDKYVDKTLVNDVNGNPMMHDGKLHSERVLAADGFNYVTGSKEVILVCAGDWYAYKFKVAEAGTYVFGVCAATDRDTPYVIYVDGKKVGTGIFNEAVTNPQYGTADYETFDNSDLLALELTAGEHTIKVAIEEIKNHNVYVKSFWLRAEDYVVGGGNSNTQPPVNGGDPDDSTWQSIIDAAKEAEKITSTKENSVWKELYVSPNGKDTNNGSKSAPFATLAAANAAVKSLRSQMKGDIVIHVASGIYPISQPLVIGVDGGGANGYRVIYRGDSDNMPVISGGVQITGWTKDGNIWSAPCNVDDTRTLYINDNPAVRARSKYLYKFTSSYVKGGTGYTSDGLIVKHNNFPVLSNQDDVELVFDSEWMHHRYPVASITYGSGQAILEMQQPYWNKLFSISGYNVNFPTEGKGFYLENAIELLDEPGEFYFDRDAKRIYYYPFPEENMETAKCYVGVTETLVQITGTDKSTRVDGLTFENIQFKYGAWNDVSTTGLLSNQADCLRDTNNPTNFVQMPSQVRVEYAQNITFRGCVFACLGSTALGLPNAVSDVVIDGNVFKDISGIAISVGWTKQDKNMPGNMARPTRIDITNNVIRRIGYEFRCSPAVVAYYVSYVRIMHNDIADVPYTGISLGWGWGQDIKECTNNLIAYNKIVNVTNPTHDGAHIYTLSPNYNTYINNNWCVGSGDQRGGIYPDEGSAYMNIFHNVVEDMNKYWLFARKDVNLHDINVFCNYSDTSTVLCNEPNVTLEAHTVVTNGNWSDTAKQIMNNAGVTSAYQALLKGVEAPTWRTNFVTAVPSKY